MDEWARIVLERLSAASADREDWIDLLDLAVERQIPEARRLAIQKITQTFRHTREGMTQVVMARKYRVKEWLQDGLETLVQDEQFVSDADAHILGFEWVLRLARLRENHIRRQRGSYYGLGHMSVANSFRDELEEMD